MLIRSRLFVVTFVLSLSIGVGCHSAYAEFMAPFDEEDGLEAFQSKSQMRHIAPEPEDIMREDLKDEALAEKEVQQIEDIEAPATYMSNKVLSDEISAVNLAQRMRFDYAKAATALSAPHAPTMWDKFLNFIRWDKILSFLERNQASAEQWEQVYVK